MFTLKQSVAASIPVVIIDAAGSGVTGIAYNSALLTPIAVAKAGAVAVAKTLDASDWVEIGNGAYWIKLSAAELDTPGAGVLNITYAGETGTYPFDVHAQLEADVKGDTAAIKLKTDTLPAAPASEATVAAAGAAIDAVSLKVTRALGLLDENTVRDQVVFSGTDVTSARIRIYDSAANATAAGATGLVATYVATYVYSAPGVLTSALVIKQ